MKNVKNKNLDVVFILDKSGSMSGSVEDTIGGYNTYLSQNKNEYTKITTVLFDSDYQLLNFREDSRNVKNLRNNDYIPSGCTALYDAIGKTVNKLDKEKITNKVLFIITTDGLENASFKYNKKDIVSIIKKHPNYKFIYLGADIDSYKEGEKLGISKENTANFSKSKMENVFRSMTKISQCMMNDKEIDSSWKENLQ